MKDDAANKKKKKRKQIKINPAILTQEPEIVYDFGTPVIKSISIESFADNVGKK